MSKMRNAKVVEFRLIDVDLLVLIVGDDNGAGCYPFSRFVDGHEFILLPSELREESVSAALRRLSFGEAQARNITFKDVELFRSTCSEAMSHAEFLHVEKLLEEILNTSMERMVQE